MKFSQVFNIKNKQGCTITPSGRGFTLVELLVVISIIGVLSSVVFASLSRAKEKARNATIQSNLTTLRSEAELFFDSNDGYKTTSSPNYADGSCHKSGVGGSVPYPQSAAANLGVFFASNNAWNALQGSTGLMSSTANTASRCLVYPGQYAIALTMADSRVICIDYTGTIKISDGATSAWNSIDQPNRRCKNL